MRVFSNGLNNDGDKFGYIFCNNCVKKLDKICMLKPIFGHSSVLKKLKKESDCSNCIKCNKFDLLLYNIKLDSNLEFGLCRDCVFSENVKMDYENFCCGVHNCVDKNPNTDTFIPCNNEYCKGRLFELKCKCKVCTHCNNYLLFNGIITDKKIFIIKIIYFRNLDHKIHEKYILSN